MRALEQLFLGAVLCQAAMNAAWGQVNTPLQPTGIAPPGEVLRPGHLGRQTGDLEQIIHFYHDLLGAGIRGERDQARPFWSSEGLLDFANTPKDVQFRAVILPIPGTAAEPDTEAEMAVEAIEFRNMERHQYIHQLHDAGSSHLVLVLRDLDAVVKTLSDAGVLVVTAGGQPIEVPVLYGAHEKKRAIIVRDPDGYPVELIELSPPPASNAPEAGNILGARISITVADLQVTQRLYRDLIGPELMTWASPAFTGSEAYNQLRNTPGAEFRHGAALIPGSPVLLEFIQYRNIEQRSIQPRLQDIGVGHILFMVRDIDLMMGRIRAAGLSTLSASGEPVFIAPGVPAVFVTDNNHFFMEFMARLPQEQR